MAPTLSQKWACDLPGSAIVIFLHPFAASAMAAKAVGKPARAMRALTFGNETAHGGIVKNSWAPRRALHRHMTVPAGRRAGRSKYKVAVGIDDAVQAILCSVNGCARHGDVDDMSHRLSIKTHKGYHEHEDG